MSFFIDQHNRRKTTIALTAFCVGFLYACLFVALSILLAGPLYDTVQLGSAAATTAVHAVVIALVGTAICCLTFLLQDKRIAPYSFVGMAVWLCMFYAAALLLEADARSYMLQLITMFGLAPVLVGNAVTWPIYLKIKRANPALNHRKTIREELNEAVKEEAAKHPERPTEENASEPAAPTAQPEPTLEEAMFGPEAGAGPRPAYRSVEEEAMLFYEDEEENDN